MLRGEKADSEFVFSPFTDESSAQKFVGVLTKIHGGNYKLIHIVSQSGYVVSESSNQFDCWDVVGYVRGGQVELRRRGLV